ncbi:GreA/GreB family elongation factor, partial [candidate division WWE3 bacterium]|nr:GreA/GreB family elongation factor [candidate division WWE3 bacterium]
LYLINEQLDQINEQIENSVVVQEALISQNKPTVIDFGTKALLIINTEEVTYTFLGEAEADPAKGIISITSPLGSALKGKKPGDVVTVPIASGTLTVTVFELLDVQE